MVTRLAYTLHVVPRLPYITTGRFRFSHGGQIADLYGVWHAYLCSAGNPGRDWEGGVRGVRKPQNRTEIRQKNRKPHQILSRIPKPHVHGGPLYESGHHQDLWYINITRTIITLTLYCPKLLYCTVLFTTNQMPSMWVMYLNECCYLAWLWKNCLWSCTSCTGWLITLDDLVLVVERDLSCSWIKATKTWGCTAVRANTRHGISRCRRIIG